jgi:hypothetical protein
VADRTVGLRVHEERLMALTESTDGLMNTGIPGKGRLWVMHLREPRAE